MDDFYFFSGELRRAFSISPIVQAIGYIPTKSTPVRSKFDSMNFSFILSGSGYYSTPHKTYKVIAPCVILQSPGIVYDYAPESEWEELYMIFSKQDYDYFKDKNIIRDNRPIWYFQNSDILQNLINVCNTINKNHNEFAFGDRLDQLCINSITESLITQNKPRRTENEEIVMQIKKKIESQYLKLSEVKHLIDSQKIKEFTFRKIWNQNVAIPPHHYLIKLKVLHAARQLVETDKSISEISYELNIEDPLYFSRIFTKEYKCSPRIYRKSKQAIRSIN